MCSWSNTQNANADKLDWELTSLEAESHYPIPPEDHSLGTEKGNPDFWQCTLWYYLPTFGHFNKIFAMRVYRPISSPPGHFLFFPSSNRTAANENAQLLSPHLPPTKSTCLKFWAYKPYSCKGGCGWESLSGVTRMPFGIF